jgi:sortase B
VAGGYYPGKAHGKRKGGKSRLPLWQRVTAYLLFALLLFSASGLVNRLLEYRRSADEYAGISKLMETGEAPPEETPAAVLPAPSATAASSGAVLSFASAPTAVPVLYFNSRIRSLKVKNGDTVGYLEIEGTGIGYPVVQARNNDYYETHTFLKKVNASGAVFMDSANDVDLDDFNVVLYGHNMRDGSMFHDLLQYRKATFAEEHRIITLTGLYRQHTYFVFAAYTCTQATDMRGFGCVSDQSRQAFLTAAMGRSIITAGDKVPKASDRIITLITCREDVEKNYFVVQALRLD